jgi:pyruvate,orthophosphate dikinase
MDGLPVTIRLLDPPLHEFVPKRQDEREKLAAALGISLEQLAKRADDLHESNPMMGHRGVRWASPTRRHRGAGPAIRRPRRS